MLDAMAFTRGVLVHGGAHGWDIGAMVDALTASPDRLRGIAVLPIDVPDTVLADLDNIGVRGVRFTQARGPTVGQAIAGRLELSDLFSAFAPRLKNSGWHAEIWADCSEIAAAEGSLRSLGLPLVIDHMGFFDVTLGVEDAGFQALLSMVRDGVVWVKLTMFRNSKEAPDYQDVRPFHDALVEANPQRLIWGSDFPFLGMRGDHVPTSGTMLGKLLEWLPDDDVRHQVLVDNPRQLYKFL